MSCHIVQIAPPWYPVPPHGYGGIELVVALLARGLRGRGHRVTLLATSGSEGATAVEAGEWSDDLGRPAERLRELTWAARIGDRLRQMSDAGVVHDHVGHATLLNCTHLAPPPLVHTVHGLVDERYREFYEALGDRVALVGISEAQRATAPELTWAATVHNAVDVDALQAHTTPDGDSPYLVWLARISPDKGQHVAIEVARRVGMRLVLAGKVDQVKGVEYHRDMVQPHVDGDRVVHIPNAGGADKAALLAGATAMLAPLQWDEPFGLSLVEAMASGTPVVTTRRGAAPELVEDGRTGFIVDGEDAMVEALRRVGDIDRAECARLARERFDGRAMVDGYMRVYRQVLGQSL